MAKKKNNTTTIVTEANLLDTDKVILSNNQTEPPTTIINTEGVEVKKEKTLGLPQEQISLPNRQNVNNI